MSRAEGLYSEAWWSAEYDLVTSATKTNNLTPLHHRMVMVIYFGLAGWLEPGQYTVGYTTV